jgi:hypothetical protein
MMPPEINCQSSPNEHEELVPVNKALALAAIFPLPFWRAAHRRHREEPPQGNLHQPRLAGLWTTG